MKRKIAAICLFLIAFTISGCGPGQFLGPALTPTPTPKPVSISRVNAKVEAVVAQGNIQDYVRCNLDAAAWGNYDIKVTVSQLYKRFKAARLYICKGNLPGLRFFLRSGCSCARLGRRKRHREV